MVCRRKDTSGRAGGRRAGAVTTPGSGLPSRASMGAPRAIESISPLLFEAAVSRSIRASEACRAIASSTWRWHPTTRIRLVMSIGPVDPMDQRAEGLGQHFHFTAADLAANRAGAMTSSQRRRLLFADSGQLFWAVVTSVATVGVVAFGIAYRVGAIVLFAAITGFMAGLSWWRFYKGVEDVLSGQCAVVEGNIAGTRTLIGNRAAKEVFFYRVGGRAFNVDRAALDAFVTGQSYRVYFTPRSGRIVSIEPAL